MNVLPIRHTATLAILASVLSTIPQFPAHADVPAANIVGAKPLPFTGVNLAGAEFGAVKPGIPPRFEQDYSYPHGGEVDYFRARGMNVFRVPFHWEAIQHMPRTPLVPEERARLRDAITAITSRGGIAILDPHNYARFYGKPIGGGEIGSEDLADLWGRLADEFKSDPHVWFDLMNEPHDIPSSSWVDAANASIAAIRKTGATNRILVPGNHWTGAHSWTSSDNGALMLQIHDPADNYAYDVHQYLDKDSSGSHAEVVSPTIGAERLRAFTEWCRANKKRAFLGEFGTAAGESNRDAIEAMLKEMESAPDVWLGYAWWAAGPRWGEYMFTLEPTRSGVDRPQLSYLQPHLQPQTAMTGAAGTGKVSSALHASETTKKTIRLLCVGNSFSGNATTYLSNLAKADGNTLIFRNDSIPGGTLQQHWDKLKQHEADPKAAAGLYSPGHSLESDLPAQPWDFVTIQQASIKSHDPATYHPYAEDLLAYIRKRAPQATVLIHETWAYRRDDPRFAHPEKATGIEPGTQKRMYDELSAAYEALAKGLGGLRIIPVGDAFYHADTDPTWGYQPNPTFDPKKLTYPTPPTQLHSLHRGWYWETLNVPAPVLKQDCHHASTAGQYLAGCVWYEVLFGKSAVGNTFIPKGLDSAYAHFLQETAHTAVAARRQ